MAEGLVLFGPQFVFSPLLTGEFLKSSPDHLRNLSKPNRSRNEASKLLTTIQIRRTQQEIQPQISIHSGRVNTQGPVLLPPRPLIQSLDKRQSPFTVIAQQ